MMTTRYKTGKVASAIALVIGLMLSSASSYAQSAEDALRGRVEDELLSDGISLARLGQRLELRPSGTALEVVLTDAASGKLLTSRTVDTLPANQAAAVAQLTVVVSDLLRARGIVLGADAGATGGWDATFVPAAVVAYHRPTSLAVVAVAKPGRPGEETRAAAAALVAAYRAAGIATVKDGAALGEVSGADDAAIVIRAAQLSVDRIAIVRAFAQGPSVHAVVTIYGANRQLVTSFSAIAGQALAAPAAPPSSDAGVADHILGNRSAEPSLDQDGVVRLWVEPKDPDLQLLRHYQNVVGRSKIVCRSPCGVVVDGSLGERFAFGKMDRRDTEPFQLIGHHGDVTATVKPTDRGAMV